MTDNPETIDKLLDENQNLRLKNNALQMEMAEITLMKNSSGDLERQYRYLKEDNASLREDIRRKDRELRDMLQSANFKKERDSQDFDSLANNQSLMETNSFLMRLLQQLYGNLGDSFGARNLEEEKLAARRVSDYLTDILKSDRIISKGLSP